MSPTPLRVQLRVRSAADLRADGISRHRQLVLLRDGRMTKLGSRWFGVDETPSDVAQSLRRDRRLTCVSALAHHGLWTPGVTGRHEIGVRNGMPRASTSSNSHDFAAHGYLRQWPDAEPILPVRLALLHAARCVEVEDLAILLESAANRRVLSRAEIDDLLAAFPQRTQRAIGRVEHRAQSGTETAVRRFLERRGVRVRVQVGLLPDERMDMLVGEKLVIECDSRAHHDDPRAYAVDRRRDQQLLLRGYVVLRLTWYDVMVQWERTQRILCAAIAQELHRVPRGRRGLVTP